MNQYPVSDLTQTIEKGPQKGVITTPEVKTVYDNSLADLDEIAADSDGQPFYVAGNLPHFYLYLDLPIGTYSTWYQEEDLQTRQLRYWELHPEKRPKYCYIPYYYSFYYNQELYSGVAESNEQQVLAFLKSISDCTVTKGRAGYIVKIEKWK